MKTVSSTISLVVLLLVPLQFLAAQPYTFKVLMIKGKTELKSGEVWANIKTGASLQLTDQIKVSENAYLGLLHASGATLEIKNANTYLVTSLSSQIGKPSPLINKYVDFVLSQEEEKKSRLTATGSVHRALKAPIVVYLPKTADHYGNTLSVQWHADQMGDEFKVTVTNLLDELLEVYTVKANTIILNLNEGKLKDAPHISIQVSSNAGNKSDNHIIKKIEGAKRTAIAGSFADMDDVMTQQTALNKFLLASVFEEKLMLTDALTTYKQAADLAPEAEVYNEAYQSFLKRLGF